MTFLKDDLPREAKEEQKLLFRHLPGFASFILEHALEDFVSALIRYSVEEKVPLLSFFKHLSETQLVEMSMEPTKEFLTALLESNTAEYIRKSVANYIQNQLPLIEREQILTQDITIGSFVRRKTFRQFVTRYTQDTEHAFQIMEELDRFISASEVASFSAYMEIQQENITRINQQLSQQQEELLELQEIAGMGSFTWNLENQQISFTPGVSRILETTETMEAADFMENIHPLDRQRVKEALEAAMSEQQGIADCEYRYKKGDVEKAIWSRIIIDFQDERPVMIKGTLMDVTAKHKIIEQLQESEATNKQSQALTHIGNWSWEIGENKVKWSDEMYRIYGLEPQSEEINFERFLSLIHPDDRQRRLEEIEESLKTKNVKDYVQRVVNPDGTEKVLRGKGELITNDKGEPIRLMGTCQDITLEHSLNNELRNKTIQLEKLNASLEAKNTELEHINKELESFTYVASHDLQEPLRKIRIFTDRILETESALLPPQTSGYFEKILLSSTRMQHLIEDLLKFSRTSVTENDFEPVDLNKLLEEVGSIASQSFEDKQAQIEITTLPEVNGIRFQLQQLFLNLISNSVKYSRESITPIIRITSRRVNGEQLDIPHVAKSKDYFEIRLEDNGIGFDQENAEKIFDLFQRLHGRDKYSGTGIGLAICKKIVYNHHGFIIARGKPMEGAAFLIYFPAE